MTLACGIFLLAAARVRSRNLVTNAISVARMMTLLTLTMLTLALLTLAMLTLTLLTMTMLIMMLKRRPCSEEYLPVEEEDEHEGEEEGGAGGKDLVGQLLAHLNAHN